MNLINRIKKTRRQVDNIYKMLKYGFLEEKYIQGVNIKYGPDKKQYYRVYDAINSKSTIFFVHGGGWCQGSPILYSGVGKYLCKHGYTTIIAGYRLVPKYTYPVQIEDAFKAFSHYILNNNVKRIIIGGYSAGAEIASHLVFDTHRQGLYKINNSIITGFLSLSGVLNFLECDSKSSRRLIKNYIRNNEIDDLNPMNLLGGEINISTMLIHGDDDTLINVKNSITFFKNLRELNKNTILKIIKNVDHEHIIDIIRGSGNKYSTEILDFLNKL
ncbi:MAG: alpha/beta hydrolase [Romboutsia sp.]